MNLLVISYLTTAISFALLGFGLLFRLKWRQRSSTLTAACLVTALWGTVNALGVAFPVFHFIFELLEILRDVLWLVFIWDVSSASGKSRTMEFVAAGIRPWIIFTALIAFELYVHHVKPEPASLLYLSNIFTHVALAVLGMVSIEQLFRNTHPESRWGIKFMSMGAGIIFSYDFYMYSDAMLFRQIDASLWTARGFVDAFAVPLILVSAVRNPQWSLQVRTSRHVVFHTMALFGSGAYLLVMAAAGYYIRIIGGSWGAVLQIAFFFGTTVLLLIIFFSGGMRSKLRVTLSKHFFNYKYDYREEWLRFTRTLLASKPNEQIYEAAINAVAVLVESPAGALWMEQETGSGYVFFAHHNIALPQSIVPPQDSMVRFLARSKWVINIDEYIPNPALYGDLVMPEWLLALDSAWLVVPLMLYEQLLGFIVLAAPRTKVQFNWEVSDLLKAAGHQLASHLAQKRANDALVVAKQFDSFNRMSAFVVHELKNLIMQLSLMVSNAEKHGSNPEFQADMLSTVENSVQKMNHLLQQLHTSNQAVEQTAVDIYPLLEAVIQEKAAYRPVPQLQGEAGKIVLANREMLGRVIGHLIQNACEATENEGKVSVRLKSSGASALIEVEDSGKGMDENFIRDHLFRPFDSTKRSGMGIGAYECLTYVRELGGTLEVSSKPGRGSLFKLTLPMVENVT
ncbi:MAG TPA: XrtA/PEP-CTERM system histidine kinase PrsK [Burkholderiales bacterium]|nr:XrtA/PEP-CTERM system histidine kinase PrsK [Burkholderiales bacterium]